MYLVLKRSDRGDWQAVAGGGEGHESAEEAAIRETMEELGIESVDKIIHLESICTIPVVNFQGAHWPEDILVIPEFTFGIELPDQNIRLSNEHVDFRWCNYAEARSLYKWDSHKSALWELNERLTREKYND